MKMRFLLTSAILFMANSSYAGCYNWKENGYENPEFGLICFKDKCDITRKDFTCANVQNTSRGYEAGWHFETQVEENINYVSWKGDPLPVDQHKYLRCFKFEDATRSNVVGNGNCW